MDVGPMSSLLDFSVASAAHVRIASDPGQRGRDLRVLAQVPRLEPGGRGVSTASGIETVTTAWLTIAFVAA
jgi:hypothetical protein